MADLKQRLTDLIQEIHTNLLELSKFDDYDNIRPNPHPPASAEQIARYERYLGITLPPSYRAFLELHNGYAWLAYPGDMLAVEDVQPRGKWFDRVEKWKKRTAKYGAGEVLDSIVIANLGQPNNWGYIDANRPSKGKDELTVVEWDPEQPEDYPTVIEFLEECLATIKYGIAEANGTLPEDDEDD